MTSRKPFQVRKRSVEDVVAEMPHARPFDHALPPIDIFIGSAGFEERVLAIPRQLKVLGTEIEGLALLGRYRTNPEENAHREAELLPLLEQLGATPTFFDADSPEDTKRAIASALEALSKPECHIAFDISGASSTLIFSAISSLIGSSQGVRLTVLYSAAAKYHEPETVGREDPMVLWSQGDLRETGVGEVDHNELYRGIHHDHLPGFVIAFPSMYSARLQRCLSHLGVGPLSGADDSVYWVLPMTTDGEHRWRQEQIKQALITLIHGEEDRSDEGSSPRALPEDRFTHCDVADYRGCVRIVLGQIDAKSGANISVIHMGTKLQAIGVALALGGRPEVALVSARPVAFAARTYSQGVGHMLCIEFDDLSSLAQRISDVGMLDVEPA